MNSLTLKLDQASADKISKLINRLAAQSGIGIENAVKWAAWYVGKTAASRTKKAPKTRRVLRNRGDQQNHPPARYPWFWWTWSGSSGKRRRVFSTARTKAEAEADPRRVIKRRGLARSVWFWSIKRIGVRGSANGTFMADAADWGRFLFRRGENPSAEVTNRLRYAADALPAERRESIGERATYFMGKALDRELYRIWK